MSTTACQDCLGSFEGQFFVAFDPTGNEIRDDAGDIIACGCERLVCHDCFGWYREGVEISEVEAEDFP